MPTAAVGKLYVASRGNDSCVLGELEVYDFCPTEPSPAGFSPCRGKPVPRQ